MSSQEVARFSRVVAVEVLPKIGRKRALSSAGPAPLPTRYRAYCTQTDSPFDLRRSSPCPGSGARVNLASKAVGYCHPGFFEYPIETTIFELVETADNPIHDRAVFAPVHRVQGSYLLTVAEKHRNVDLWLAQMSCHGVKPAIHMEHLPGNRPRVI